MGEQFGRKYLVQVFDKTGAIVFSTFELRVVFKVKKGLSSTPNQAKIEIYNMNDESNDSILESGDRIVLHAGYKDLSDVIFEGQLRTAIPTQKDVDDVMVIVAGDGDKGNRFGSVNITLSGGVTMRHALEQLTNTMPEVKIGTTEGIEGKNISERGVSFSGSTKLLLNALARSYEFTWSIQDGVLETVAITGGGATIGDVQTTAYVISPNTGMIGKPDLMDENKVKVRSLLNPRVKPGRAVKIDESTKGNGFYKVSTVDYDGDTKGNNWFVDIGGVQI